jgi:hypothetical protein
MANPKIEVEIGAVIDGLRKGFGESVKIIETLEKQALDLDKALRAATDLPTIQGLNTQLAQTKSALSQLRNSGLDPLTKATSNYNSVGTDFARIIQDAPFGIIGVGNNITQLAGSFQVLKNETGSTAAALKAGFASILSPGNALVLVISLVTSALTAYQMGAFDSKEETKDLEKETESFDQTLRKVIDSLDAVRQARLEGSKGASDEIIQLDLLNRALTDTNQPQNVRIAAYKKLKEEYPTILSNISQEQALAKGLGDAYLKVVSAITQRASAVAIEEKLVELAKQRFDILEKEANETSLQNTLLKQRETLMSQIAERGIAINKNGLTLAEIFGDQTVDFSLVNLGESIVNVNKQFNLLGNVVAPKTQSELTKNDAATEKLKNQFFDLNLELTDFFQLSNNSSESTQKLKRSFEEIGNLGPLLDRLKLERFDKFRQEVEAPFTISSGKAETQGIIEPKKAIPNELNDQALTFNSNLQSIGETIQELTAGFGGLGAIIGSAFGNNPKLGQFIAQFVGFAAKLIATNFKIAASNAVAGASQAAAATGPAAPLTLPAFIAGALGLVAAAFAAFGGGGKKGGAGGGGGGGGGMGGSGVGGGSQFAGTGSQGGMFAANKDLNGELVVRGQDLVYVFGQANNRINKG